MSPYLDYCHDDDDPDAAKKEAKKLEDYWRKKIKSVGGNGILGVLAERDPAKKNGWRIRVNILVSTDSQAYKDVIRRLGGL